ncbi:MAG: PspC domain-containing protein [Bacillota bacterium]|jgi:phage shock protein C|nr:PspC domain-containing protein [Candidatus Fermentithermobacillaceae bacterium]
MKKVYRSRHTKVLGGVAAGLADYFGMDVTIMRLLFALLLVTVPNVVIAYILAWIIIPEEPAGTTQDVSPARTADATSMETGGQSSTGGMTAEEILRSSGESQSPGLPGEEVQKAETPAASTPKGADTVSPSPAGNAQGSSMRSRQFTGFVLIAVGLAVIFRRYVPSFVWRLPFNLIGQGWPVLIIIAGVAIILSAVRGR